jgi:hypothetical protein
MEFLAYGDDAENNSETEAVSSDAVEGPQITVQTKCRWTEVSSDDDSGDDDEEMNGAAVTTITSKSQGTLPSAEDLFSTVVPTFAIKATKEILDEVTRPPEIEPPSKSADNKVLSVETKGKAASTDGSVSIVHRPRGSMAPAEQDSAHSHASKKGRSLEKETAKVESIN